MDSQTRSYHIAKWSKWKHDNIEKKLIEVCLPMGGSELKQNLCTNVDWFEENLKDPIWQNLHQQCIKMRTVWMVEAGMYDLISEQPNLCLIKESFTPVKTLWALPKYFSRESFFRKSGIVTLKNIIVIITVAVSKVKITISTIIFTLWYIMVIITLRTGNRCCHSSHTVL